MLFGDERLRDHDRVALAELARRNALALTCRVPASKSTIRVPDNTVLILDEADSILLDQQVVVVLGKNNGSYCIGLTATPYDRMLSQERDYLMRDLGFAVHDSGIQAEITDRQEPERARLDLAAFLDLKDAAGMAKLIYLDEVSGGGDDKDRKVAAWVAVNGRTLRRNVADLDVLRCLTSQDVLLVTKPALMRGFDYRCATGIALFLARRFESRRASFQACGRVGRYGEPCRRVVASDIQGELYETDIEHLVKRLKENRQALQRATLLSMRPAPKKRPMRDANQGTLQDCFAHARGRATTLGPSTYISSRAAGMVPRQPFQGQSKRGAGRQSDRIP